MQRPGYVVLTLRAGEALERVPVHLDLLSGAARAASRLDRGPLDRALRPRSEGFRAVGVFHARRSLAVPGEQHVGYDDVEQSLGMSRTYRVRLAGDRDRDILAALSGISESAALRQHISDAQWASIDRPFLAGDVPPSAYGWDPRVIKIVAHLTHSGPAFGWSNHVPKAIGRRARDLYEETGGDIERVLLTWARLRSVTPEQGGALLVSSQIETTMSYMRNWAGGYAAAFLVANASGPLDIDPRTVATSELLRGRLVLKQPGGGFQVLPALSAGALRELTRRLDGYLREMNGLRMADLLAALAPYKPLHELLRPEVLARAAPLVDEQRLWWASRVAASRAVPPAVHARTPFELPADQIEEARRWVAAHSRAAAPKVKAKGLASAPPAAGAPLVYQPQARVAAPAAVRSPCPARGGRPARVLERAVLPASLLPAQTLDGAGAVRAALAQAGLSAAQVASVVVAPLEPLGRFFGAAALAELLARLRWAPALIAGHGGGRKAPAVLAGRLLLHVPGHFRELARRAPDARDAHALESIGWLSLAPLAADIQRAIGGKPLWLPPAPAFAIAFPTRCPRCPRRCAGSCSASA